MFKPRIIQEEFAVNVTIPILVYVSVILYEQFVAQKLIKVFSLYNFNERADLLFYILVRTKLEGPVKNSDDLGFPDYTPKSIVHETKHEDIVDGTSRSLTH